MSDAFDSKDLSWGEEALCARPENSEMQEKMFSTDPVDKHEAKNLCFSCDVRDECLRYALENNVIWGIWGGRDKDELRRALSLSSEGKEIRRNRAPQCPRCSARTSRLSTKIKDLPNGGRWTTARMVECHDCGFEWRSRTSANAVDAYHTARAEKRARRQRDREKLIAKGKAMKAAKA